MHLLIDVQPLQSESRYRGIGRYAKALVRAMVVGAHGHRVTLLMNDDLPETVEAIRSEFGVFLQQRDMIVFHAGGPTAELDPANHPRTRAAEQHRESVIASLRPDAVLITSLFEGLIDGSIVSAGRISGTWVIACVLYDLIPFIRQEEYLANETIRDYYFRKVNSLQQCDILLAISDYTRREGLEGLGFPSDRVVNISAALNPEFTNPRFDASLAERTWKRFGIHCSPILYAGGFDSRKNIDGLIRAYALMSNQLREKHQLVIAGKHAEQERIRLQVLASELGLADRDIVFTGYVSDPELAALYGSCRLFVFPSRHEGFGLPALEAMTCGAAVIAANATSVPEVVGNPEALFDPDNLSELSRLMERGLTDEAYRERLLANGRIRSTLFSWPRTASVAWTAIEAAVQGKSAVAPVVRPRLAFVAPMPPAKTGIADYCEQLLRFLDRHYRIEIITDATEMSSGWSRANHEIRSPDWLRQNLGSYDRVMYHIGNSPFHAYMLPLLRDIPGIVVLHDFYLSSLYNWLEFMAGGETLPSVLYRSHGYQAAQFDCQEGRKASVGRFPCNADVLSQAKGILVHSQYARHLAEAWYTESVAQRFLTVPFPKPLPVFLDKAAARRRLGLPSDALVICSFGIIAPTKCNLRLLEVWLGMDLAARSDLYLIFVGENEGGEYGASLKAMIARADVGPRIVITGHVDAGTFRDHLAAADGAVQLRTQSRGETSAAVYDCLAYGLPLVINANGSLNEVPGQVCIKLPDRFDDRELSEALTLLTTWGSKREDLGTSARAYCAQQHDPAKVALSYHAAIESVYAADPGGYGIPSIVSGKAGAVRQQTIYVDISNLVQQDLRTGIERVTRSILAHLLRTPPVGFRIEPVYERDGLYMLARRFVGQWLSIPGIPQDDLPAEPQPGDHFLGLELCHFQIIRCESLLTRWRVRGIKVHIVVYDLLPILQPQFFPDWMPNLHRQWLTAAGRCADNLIAISDAVRNETLAWLDANQPKRINPLQLTYFHLGCDVTASVPSSGLPVGAEAQIAVWEQGAMALMVGTVEPRKGHGQILSAMEILWAKDVPLQLVIVGKKGWGVDPLVDRLNHHPELGRRLHWLHGISDEYLEKIYTAADFLICPSEGEGFGLPIVEAARKGIPLLLRDIPVFREVAGEFALYFAGDAPVGIANVIEQALTQAERGILVPSLGIDTLSWSESTEQLLDAMHAGSRTLWWQHGVRLRLDPAQGGIHTQVGIRGPLGIKSSGQSGMLVFGPYVSMPMGNYKISIACSNNLICANPGWLDATCQGGSRVMIREEIRLDRDYSREIIEARCEIPTECHDFELRVWVPAGAELEIHDLEVGRVHE